MKRIFFMLMLILLPYPAIACTQEDPQTCTEEQIRQNWDSLPHTAELFARLGAPDPVLFNDLSDDEQSSYFASHPLTGCPECANTFLKSKYRAENVEFEIQEGMVFTEDAGLCIDSICLKTTEGGTLPAWVQGVRYAEGSFYFLPRLKVEGNIQVTADSHFLPSSGAKIVDQQLGTITVGEDVKIRLIEGGIEVDGPAEGDFFENVEGKLIITSEVISSQNSVVRYGGAELKGAFIANTVRGRLMQASSLNEQSSIKRLNGRLVGAGSAEFHDDGSWKKVSAMGNTEFEYGRGDERFRHYFSGDFSVEIGSDGAMTKAELLSEDAIYADKKLDIEVSSLGTRRIDKRLDALFSGRGFVSKTLDFRGTMNPGSGSLISISETFGQPDVTCKGSDISIKMQGDYLFTMDPMTKLHAYDTDEGLAVDTISTGREGINVVIAKDVLLGDVFAVDADSHALVLSTVYAKDGKPSIMLDADSLSLLAAMADDPANFAFIDRKMTISAGDDIVSIDQGMGFEYNPTESRSVSISSPQEPQLYYGYRDDVKGKTIKVLQDEKNRILARIDDLKPKDGFIGVASDFFGHIAPSNFFGGNDAKLKELELIYSELGEVSMAITSLQNGKEVEELQAASNPTLLAIKDAQLEENPTLLTAISRQLDTAHAYLDRSQGTFYVEEVKKAYDSYTSTRRFDDEGNLLGSVYVNADGSPSLSYMLTSATLDDQLNIQHHVTFSDDLDAIEGGIRAYLSNLKNMPGSYTTRIDPLKPNAQVQPRAIYTGRDGFIVTEENAAQVLEQIHEEKERLQKIEAISPEQKSILHGERQAFQTELGMQKATTVYEILEPSLADLALGASTIKIAGKLAGFASDLGKYRKVEKAAAEGLDGVTALDEIPALESAYWDYHKVTNTEVSRKKMGMPDSMWDRPTMLKVPLKNGGTFEIAPAVKFNDLKLNSIAGKMNKEYLAPVEFTIDNYGNGFRIREDRYDLSKKKAVAFFGDKEGHFRDDENELISDLQRLQKDRGEIDETIKDVDMSIFGYEGQRFADLKSDEKNGIMQTIERMDSLDIPLPADIPKDTIDSILYNREFTEKFIVSNGRYNLIDPVSSGTPQWSLMSDEQKADTIYELSQRGLFAAPSSVRDPDYTAFDVHVHPFSFGIDIMDNRLVNELEENAFDLRKMRDTICDHDANSIRVEIIRQTNKNVAQIRVHEKRIDELNEIKQRISNEPPSQETISDVAASLGEDLASCEFCRDQTDQLNLLWMRIAQEAADTEKAMSALSSQRDQMRQLYDSLEGSQDMRDVFFKVVNLGTTTPSPADVLNTAQKNTMDRFIDLPDGSKVSVNKVVYPHGLAYVVYEKGAEYASVITTNGKEYTTTLVTISDIQ